MATYGHIQFPPESAAAPSVLAPISVEEHTATINAMRPPKRQRPVVAVIGQNEGAEITDFVVPYGVLARSGLADVIPVAPRDGAIKLTPALSVAADASTAEFDRRFPDGADYVIVPKIEDSADPQVVTWIQEQSAKGAIIVGICAGTKTLSAAGLFAGRRATAHWYDIAKLREDNPSMTWVQDRRYVVDGNVVTTTGVSASIPISLALVEAIGGRARATELAAELGATNWDARHDSSAFYLDRTDFWVQLRNSARIWAHEELGVPVSDGIDEISLALVADVYSRTRQSIAVSLAKDLAPVTTRSGLRLLPDYAIDDADLDIVLDPIDDAAPLKALDIALNEIKAHYDRETAAFIALQIEYAWPQPHEAVISD
ncbi:DJ-1/PfpI family protein (plasmid) [Ensifer adhaerens]|uniref:DJ-1/PfpI family protein n=1 Tax=Ensifer adhaerens TaxID=106592 RepID=UPI0023A9F226|nr:DJ-1/PfpI family protein [Ensifer adhaerens]WDZ81718.1 DJ-1/PfpI family protein [Ensifer adhaerens]